MSNIFFKFKQFTIVQDQCAMKVGTDGVLLGAWANVDGCNNILDIGTGTGLIALMLAQRNLGVTVDAIDIDEQCVVQAQQNVASSSFAQRVVVQNSSFQDFLQGADIKYDLIVCNPPFFQNALKSPSESRNFARHTNTLSFTDIIAQSSPLLADKGRLSLILPHDCKQQILDEAAKADLCACRITNVFPLPHKSAKRILVELTKDKSASVCTEESLIIELARHQYSAEFKALTDDFYLDR